MASSDRVFLSLEKVIFFFFCNSPSPFLHIILRYVILHMFLYVYIDLPSPSTGEKWENKIFFFLFLKN